MLVYPFKGHQDWTILSRIKGGVKKSTRVETPCSLAEKVLKIKIIELSITVEVKKCKYTFIKSNKTGLLIVRFWTEHLLLLYIPLICYMLTDYLKLMFMLYNLYTVFKW